MVNKNLKFCHLQIPCNSWATLGMQLSQNNDSLGKMCILPQKKANILARKLLTYKNY